MSQYSQSPTNRRKGQVVYHQAAQNKMLRMAETLSEDPQLGIFFVVDYAAELTRPGAFAVCFAESPCPAGSSRLSSSAIPFKVSSASFSSSSVCDRRPAALSSPNFVA